MTKRFSNPTDTIMDQLPTTGPKNIIAMLTAQEGEEPTFFDRIMVTLIDGVTYRAPAFQIPTLARNVLSNNIAPEKVERVREKPYHSPEQKELKKDLPAFALATFNGWLCGENVAHAAPCLPIEFDGTDNPRLLDPEFVIEAKRWFRSRPGLAYMGYSCSKSGLLSLFSIDPALTLRERGELYDALVYGFAHDKKFPLKADTSGRNVDHLRYVSVDEQPAVQRYPTPVRSVIDLVAIFSGVTLAELESAAAHRTTPSAPVKPFVTSASKSTFEPLATHEQYHNTAQDYPHTFEGVKQAIEDARKRGGLHFDEEQRWFVAGMVLAREFGPGGYDLFEELSKLSPKYNGVDCNKKYNYCLRKCWDYKGAPAKLASVFYDLRHES